MLKTQAILHLLAFPFGLVWAAEGEPLTVGAKVDRSEVPTGQTLTYSITIAGSIRETPKVELNQFEGFRVVSTGQSQQILIRGGESQLILTLNYTLAPSAPGTHTLGPVKVEYQGKVYETQPIEVKVVEAPSQPRRPYSPRLEGGVIL